MRPPAAETPARPTESGGEPTPPPPPRSASRGAHPAPSVPHPAQLAEVWADVVAAAREARPFLGTALERAMPEAVNARGELTLAMDVPDEIAEQAITTGAAEVVRAIARYVDGITRVRITRSAVPAAEPPPAPRRYTAAEVRAERVAILRRRDPTLAAAIDALELELLD